MNITKLKVDNMICHTCEILISEELASLNGVKSTTSDFATGEVAITYDEKNITEDIIKEKLIEIGYPPRQKSIFDGVVPIVLLGLLMIFLSNSPLFNFDMPALLDKGSLVLILFIGILSSFHCIGMCGGIMLTQTIGKKSTFKPSIMYNIGRVLSYTLLGGLVGALGSVFTLTPKIQGIIQVLAAIFMFITALNILNIPIFKKIKLSIPVNCKVKNNSNSPFIVGILNGLMPCGPLQTMQIYALSTGSFYLGAESMFIFAIGTVPLMVIFGSLSTLLSKKRSNQILKFSGYFLILLSVIMIQRGFTLVNSNLLSNTNNQPIISNKYDDSQDIALPIINKDGVQEITLTANSRGYSPRTLYVEKGSTVKVNIESNDLSFCTNKIIVPDLNIEKSLKSNSTTTFEFTLDKKSTINYSCWMGMKGGQIVVVDSLESLNEMDNSDLPNNNYNNSNLFDNYGGGFPSGASCH